MEFLPTELTKTLEENFIEAVYLKDKARVEELITDENLSINTRSTRANKNHIFYNYTAMEIAIVHMEHHIVRKILEHPDYDITLTDAAQETVLHYLAREDAYGQLIQRFLAHERAETIINIASDSGHTALHTACIYNHVGVTRELLKMDKIEVNGVDNNRYTPMMAAIRYYSDDTVEELLDHDVDCNFTPQLNIFPFNTNLGEAILAQRCLFMVASLLKHGAATTFTATLNLILSSEPKGKMESTEFECVNMSTLAMETTYEHVDSQIASVMAKVITACAGLADLDTVFKLYTGIIKGSNRGNSRETPDDITHQVEQKLKYLLLRSAIYKSLGTSISPELMTYLTQKYGLKEDEDYYLLIPCRIGNLQLQTTLAYREEIIKRSGAGNLVKAARLLSEEVDAAIDQEKKNLMTLDWCADYYIAEITKKGLQFYHRPMPFRVM